MPLPTIIEIEPLEKPVQAEVSVPGSKSITNRALILAALAHGDTVLRGGLWSEDTQVMAEALRRLGFELNIEPDPEEACNRTIRVKGLGGKIPWAGVADKPLDIFVGNAGTAARFLTAFVCLGPGVYRLHGVSRMHERPQGALFEALRNLGYHIKGEQHPERLPAVISGRPNAGPTRSCRVNIEASSQFASALLLCAKAGGWQINIAGENAEESAYVRLTSEMLKTFPEKGGAVQIEPDASSGSYFHAADRLISMPQSVEHSRQFGVPVLTTDQRPVRVARWPKSRWQIDEQFPEVLKRTLALHLGLEAQRVGLFSDDTIEEVIRLRTPQSTTISRKRDLGDSIMTAIVLAPFALAPIRFTDLGRLRLQECERVAALRTELTRCGGKVIETNDTLEVYPRELHGAEIETYNDHRMAMCFSILALKVPGIKIKNPACVKKTFPNFFQKLATTPPQGLGAAILDPSTGRRLGVAELFAE